MAEVLKRRIGLGLLTAYGVGVMVGAGIYVLVGAVAAEAGIWAPLSFLLAGLVAAPTALSYAEFSTRIPEAAGEAAYIAKGLNSQQLALLVGLAIVAAGVVSAAAVLQGGIGYLTGIISADPRLAVVVVGGTLVTVALVGVLESLAMAALFTVVEVAGLILVTYAGFAAEPSADLVTASPLVLSGVAGGAVLAFFAFIGFEDIVNMAEEVRAPSRTLPRAILLSLGLTSVIYAVVSYAAIRAVPIAELAESARPLALVWARGIGPGAAYLSVIAVVAALNGVLAQIVMASRVLYGLGARSSLLEPFHRAHPRTGTPVAATTLVGLTVIAGALIFELSGLAEATSTLLLGVFVLVNLALILLKRRAPDAPFRVPMAVPFLGFFGAVAALAVTFGFSL